MSEHHDVVVVGSGSTGGTVAARLAEDPACDVLLLEAGRDFPEGPGGRVPAFFVGGTVTGEGGAGSGSPSSDLDWGYVSEALPDGRRIGLPRGKLVGGTSMINGSVAVRGRPEDFARWEAAGATGWGWDDVLPHYEAAERELSIKRYPPEVWLPVQRLFAQACQELGFRYHEDLNAPDAWDEVVGPWPRNRRNEIRQGSLVTYIRRARHRENFTVREFALVDRVLFDGGETPRARGVAYVDREGRAHEVSADRVVLCAGAYGSAPILLRSGIGPAGELRALGIEPVADLPVGRGLMEHPGYRFVVEVDREHAAMGWPTNGAVARGMGWWGIPMTENEEEGLVAFGFYLGLVDGPDGSIRIASADPAAEPLIEHRYIDVVSSGGFDGVWADFQRLLATDAFRGAHARDLRAEQPWPERLARGVGTGTHPAGGCAIGAVVDPDLSVHGVDALSVADASVFPRHVSNNPNLTCHMVGEYAAAKLSGVASARRGSAPASGA